jgi:hypothetical protein
MAVSGVGFLATVSGKAREFIDEPGTSSKFSDARILDMMRRALADVTRDVDRSSVTKIRARASFAVVADQREYVLPPYSKFLELKKLNDSGELEWEIIPKNSLAPTGPGFTIEGPMLRFDPNWGAGYTLELVYIPARTTTIFEATAPASGVGASTITVPSSATEGTVNLYANAYLGWVVRILSDPTTGAVQDRVVYSQDDTTPGQPVFTVKPAWSPALTDDNTVVFEVVPDNAYEYEDLVALKVARFIAAITGDRDRLELIQIEYRDAMRALRLQAANAEQRVGPHMTRVTRFRSRWGKTT